MTPARTPRTLSVLFAGALSFAGGAVAQPAAPSTSHPTPHTEPATPATDSPRVSLSRFHDLAQRGRWSECVRYLDLPPSLSDEGPLRAQELSEVINYHLGWDLDELSGASQGDVDDGLPPRVDEVGQIPLGRGNYDSLRVQRREFGDGARWVFTRASVQHADVWFGQLEGRWAREHLPASLNARGPHDLRWWQWLSLPLLLLFSVIVGRFAASVVRWGVGRVMARVAVVHDAHVADRGVGPTTVLVATIVLRVMVPLLALYRDAEDYVLVGLKALLFCALFWALWRAVEVFGRAVGDTAWATEHPASVTLVPLGVKVTRLAVALVSVVAVLSTLGYPVASLLAGLGIGGLALALAAQKTGEHLFGTVAIGFDQPFRVGDSIKVDDLEGTVEAVGLRSTRLRTLDRTVISIPNGKLADMRTETVSARDRYRVNAVLGVEYGTSSDTLRSMMSGLREALAAHPKICPETPWVFFKRIGAQSLEVEVSAWFNAGGYEEFLALRSEVLITFLEVVEKSGAKLSSTPSAVLLPKGA